MWKKISKNKFLLDNSKNVLSNLRNKTIQINLDLPNLNDEIETFKIKSYEMIKTNTKNVSTFHGYNNNGNNAVITLSDNDIRVFVFDNKSNYVIKQNDNKSHYIIKIEDIEGKKKFVCNVNTDTKIIKKNINRTDVSGGRVLRIYKFLFGLSSTFKSAYGNDNELLWLRMIHIINITNYIYQNNFAVSFTINETDQRRLFPSNFNNAGESGLSGQTNQFSNTINLNSFDVGHVLATGGGGIAQLGVVCTNSKGNGWTSVPTGDVNNDQVLVVDYFCHELGHQFGMNHPHTTNSNCNGVQSISVEPGSGSMGYAGICPPNVQANSDAYFNAININECMSFLNTRPCGENIETNLPLPEINKTYSTVIIPKDAVIELYTPEITMENLNVIPDKILYSWEGTDIAPNALYRSYMSELPYRKIPSNIPAPIFDNFIPWYSNSSGESSSLNFNKIQLVNGYSGSVSASWSGKFEFIGENTEIIEFNIPDISGGESIEIDLQNQCDNLSSIDVNFLTYSGTDGTWGSDLNMRLFNNNIEIGQIGGYDLFGMSSVIGSWPSTWANNNNTTYEDIVIEIQNPEYINFGLTIRALYNQENISNEDLDPDSNANIPYLKNATSTFTSTRVFGVKAYDTGSELSITNLSVNNNNINIIWNTGDTENAPINAVNVKCWISSDNGSTYDYSDAPVYEGLNNGTAMIILSDESLNDKNLKLKFRFYDNDENDKLFILESETFTLNNSSITFNMSISQGWQLIGLPLIVDNNNYQTLFPDSIEGTLYSYTNSGGYEPQTELSPGQGYWLKFNSNNDVSISGQTISNLEIVLSKGWNLISGSTNSSIIDDNNIIIENTLYSYGVNGYVLSENVELEAGKGYWIKTNSAGTIIITV